MRKTRAVFKKIGESKGTFHDRISTVKGRNVKDLKEAEEVARIPRITIKKKKLKDPENYNNVKPDILKCEVKQPL